MLPINITTIRGDFSITLMKILALNKRKTQISCMFATLKSPHVRKNRWAGLDTVKSSFAYWLFSMSFMGWSSINQPTNGKRISMLKTHDGL